MNNLLRYSVSSCNGFYDELKEMVSGIFDLIHAYDVSLQSFWSNTYLNSYTKFEVLKDSKNEIAASINKSYHNLLAEVDKTYLTVAKSALMKKHVFVFKVYKSSMDDWVQLMNQFYSKEFQQRNKIQRYLRSVKYVKEGVLQQEYNEAHPTGGVDYAKDVANNKNIQDAVFKLVGPDQNPYWTGGLHNKLLFRVVNKCAKVYQLDMVCEQRDRLISLVPNTNNRRLYSAVVAGNKKMGQKVASPKGVIPSSLFVEVLRTPFISLRLLQYLLPSAIFALYFSPHSSDTTVAAPPDWISVSSQYIFSSHEVETSPLGMYYKIMVDQPYLIPLVACRLHLHVRCFGSIALRIEERYGPAKTFASFFDLLSARLKLKPLHKSQKKTQNNENKHNNSSHPICVHPFKWVYDDNKPSQSLFFDTWWNTIDSTKYPAENVHIGKIFKLNKNSIPIINVEWWEKMVDIKSYSHSLVCSTIPHRHQGRIHRESNFLGECKNCQLKQEEEDPQQVSLSTRLTSVQGTFPFVHTFKGMLVYALVCDCSLSYVEDPYEKIQKAKRSQEFERLKAEEEKLNGTKNWTKEQLKHLRQKAYFNCSRNQYNDFFDFDDYNDPCEPFWLLGTIYDYKFDDTGTAIVVRNVKDNNLLYRGVYSFACIFAFPTWYKFVFKSPHSTAVFERYVFTADPLAQEHFVFNDKDREQNFILNDICCMGVIEYKL